MYDIIGDIHGHVDELEHLLQKMGYRKGDGVYAHPDGREAVFVGDFIDRGPKIRAVLHLVRDMCDAGHAKAVMGNHEFNAICFHTPDTKGGGYFREHSEKNIDQHKETMDAFQSFQVEWSGFLEWFKTLPLYLELEDFRVVHACWDGRHIQWLDKKYKGISDEFLRAATDRETAGKMYMAIEETLKGKERTLPEEISISDSEGNVREECRVKWWVDPARRINYSDVLMHCPVELAENELDPSESFHSYRDEKPVFFGHYWLRGRPMLNHSNAVCLDYSVAKGGQLVAYRWNGTELAEGEFFY